MKRSETKRSVQKNLEGLAWTIKFGGLSANIGAVSIKKGAPCINFGDSLLILGSKLVFPIVNSLHVSRNDFFGRET